jgi:FAD/FMN-containing dehydrogenase
MLTVSNLFSNVPPLFSNLAKILSGDIDCSHHSIQAHSTDGSPYQVRPQAVLYPKTTSDLKHAISFAKEYSIPLTVVGGLTAGSGGGLGEGVVVDMTRYFSQIRRVNMMDHTVTVDAGVHIDDLIERLEAWNLDIPVLQKEDSRATIGGFVATKSATASTFHAGTIREWIEGMTVVVDSGEEHHIRDGITPSGRLLGIYQSVFPLLSEHGPTLRAGRREQSDDATGYSLWNTSIGPRQLLDQLVGSEGTLAIVTSVTFRVVPKKKQEVSLLLPVPSLALLESAIAIAKHHQSEGLFFFDAMFRKLTDTYHPLFIRPEVTEAPYYLVATWKGNDEHMLAQKMRTFAKALPFPYGTDHVLLPHVARKLASHTYLHSLLASYTKGAHMTATSGEGLIVPPVSYRECIEALETALIKDGGLYVVSGFAGSGHISITRTFDAQNPSYEKDLQSYREKVCSIAAGFKGGISAVGGDGLERTAALPFVFNEATREVFRKLKSAWDPHDIFNPSKKLAISNDYLLRHAVRAFI